MTGAHRTMTERKQCVPKRGVCRGSACLLSSCNRHRDSLARCTVLEKAHESAAGVYQSAFRAHPICNAPRKCVAGWVTTSEHGSFRCLTVI